MFLKDLVHELLKQNKGILTSREAKKAWRDYKTLQCMSQVEETEKLEDFEISRVKINEKIHKNTCYKLINLIQ